MEAYGATRTAFRPEVCESQVAGLGWGRERKKVSTRGSGWMTPAAGAAARPEKASPAAPSLGGGL